MNVKYIYAIGKVYDTVSSQVICDFYIRLTWVQENVRGLLLEIYLIADIVSAVERKYFDYRENIIFAVNMISGYLDDERSYSDVHMHRLVLYVSRLD